MEQHEDSLQQLLAGAAGEGSYFSSSPPSSPLSSIVHALTQEEVTGTEDAITLLTGSPSWRRIDTSPFIANIYLGIAPAEVAQTLETGREGRKWWQEEQIERSINVKEGKALDYDGGSLVNTLHSGHRVVSSSDIPRRQTHSSSAPASRIETFREQNAAACRRYRQKQQARKQSLERQLKIAEARHYQLKKQLEEQAFGSSRRLLAPRSQAQAICSHRRKIIMESLAVAYVGNVRFANILHEDCLLIEPTHEVAGSSSIISQWEESKSKLTDQSFRDVHLCALDPRGDRFRVDWVHEGYVAGNLCLSDGYWQKALSINNPTVIMPLDGSSSNASSQGRLRPVPGKAHNQHSQEIPAIDNIQEVRWAVEVSIRSYYTFGTDNRVTVLVRGTSCHPVVRVELPNGKQQRLVIENSAVAALIA